MKQSIIPATTDNVTNTFAILYLFSFFIHNCTNKATTLSKPSNKANKISPVMYGGIERTLQYAMMIPQTAKK